jgi:hypothetical protein
MQTLRREQLPVAGVLHFWEIVSDAALADQMKSLMRHSFPGETATRAAPHADAVFTAGKNSAIRNPVTNTDLISKQRGETLTANLLVQITPRA